jgi:hypothetical protein
LQDFDLTSKFNSTVVKRLKLVLCSSLDDDLLILKRNLSGNIPFSTDFLSLLLTPVTSRWTLFFLVFFRFNFAISSSFSETFAQS